MTTGTLREVLNRIAVKFVPGKEQLRDQVKRKAEIAPISSMFAVKKVDATGRPGAVIGSVDSDLGGGGWGWWPRWSPHG